VGPWSSTEDRELLLIEDQFSVQTFIVFMPVSASVLVLNTPLSTIVVVVVGAVDVNAVELWKAGRFIERLEQLD
jgi:hypothetical protein